MVFKGRGEPVVVQRMINGCVLGLTKGVDYWVINQLSESEEIANPKA